MSDNQLINRIHDDKELDKIWRGATTDQKREVLGFAEGDEKLVALALADAKESE